MHESTFIEQIWNRMITLDERRKEIRLECTAIQQQICILEEGLKALQIVLELEGSPRTVPG